MIKIAKLTAILFVTLLLLTLFFLGCTPEQRETIDQLAITAEQVTAGGEAVIDSPAGEVIPPDIKFYLSLAGAVIMTAVSAWQKYRKDQLTAATKAIVRGVEQHPDKTVKAEIKEEIKETMTNAGIYLAGNQIVEKLKYS